MTLGWGRRGGGRICDLTPTSEGPLRVYSGSPQRTSLQRNESVDRHSDRDIEFTIPIPYNPYIFAEIFVAIVKYITVAKRWCYKFNDVVAKCVQCRILS